MASAIKHGRGWCFALAAAVLHLGGLLSLQTPRAARRAAPESQIELSIVALPAPDQVASLHAPESAPPQPLAASATATHPRARAAVGQSAASKSRLEAAPLPLPAAAAGSHSLSLMSSAPMPLRSAIERATVVFDLSPRHAASTLADRGKESLRSCSAASAKECAPEQIIAVQQALAVSLLHSASARQYLAPRAAPELEHERDGGYRYRSAVFSAKIARDGSVDFSDHIAGRKRSHRDKEHRAAEKRWFLEQTEPLRLRLADAARAEARGRARRALELELERIVFATSVQAAAKRKQVLMLWEECGTDEDTRQAQKIVEAFVREHMPRHSPLGFSAAELQAFNHSQPGTRAFDPYGTQQPDASSADH